MITCDFFSALRFLFSRFLPRLPFKSSCLLFVVKPSLIFQTMNHIVSGTQYFYTNISFSLALHVHYYMSFMCLTCARVLLDYTPTEREQASNTIYSAYCWCFFLLLRACARQFLTYLCAKTREEAFNLNSFIIVNSAT